VGVVVVWQGEEQKKLDVITNNVLKKALRFTGRLSVLASEEEDVPVWLDDEQFDRVSDNLRTSDVVVEEGGKVREISSYNERRGSGIGHVTGRSASAARLCVRLV
jgi:fructose-1,6-bisphosphatase